MKVIHGLHKIKKYVKPVVALGVFDGVHLGHILILKAVCNYAKRIGGNSIVVTFFPHPQQQEILTSLEHRLRLISELGVDVCIVINFDRKFSKITAQDFIKNILVDKIAAKSIYIGNNFRFGFLARGDASLLYRLSKVHNFAVRVFDIICIGRKPVSSTNIRNLIKKGHLRSAKELLGRRVSIFGEVVKGASWGKKLGFPTANINPHHEVIPPSGVYAVKVKFENKIFHGACYIGKKPTFLRRRVKNSVEVFIFNFKKNIYGKDIEIEFIKRIRPDHKFASKELLAQQIEKDVIYIKNLFSLPLTNHNI